MAKTSDISDIVVLAHAQSARGVLPATYYLLFKTYAAYNIFVSEMDRQLERMLDKGDDIFEVPHVFGTVESVEITGELLKKFEECEEEALRLTPKELRKYQGKRLIVWVR